MIEHTQKESFDELLQPVSLNGFPTLRDHFGYVTFITGYEYLQAVKREIDQYKYEPISFDFLYECLVIGLEKEYFQKQIERLLQYWIETHHWIKVSWLRTSHSIYWNMREILRHQCWRCNHWSIQGDYAATCRYSGENKFFFESKQGEIINFMPRHLYFQMIFCESTISGSENGKPFLVLDHSQRIQVKQYNLDECPIYSESQEYHDWKEKNSLPVKNSLITL